LLMLIPRDRATPGAGRLIASGFFAGLGVYAYFVHAFFVPAILGMVLLTTEKGRRGRAVACCCAGIVLGMIPYIAGFSAMAAAVGGVEPWLEQMRSTVSAIAPFSSKLSIPDSYAHAAEMARIAITNSANESMIFHRLATSGTWLSVKYALVLGAIAVALLFGVVFHRSLGAPQRTIVLAALLLPLSYFLFTGLLGKRLWAHHFSVMIPLMYLLWSAAAFAVFSMIPRLAAFPGRLAWTRTVQSMTGIAVVALVAANLAQQERFFAELNRTGGTDNMSDALNRFSLEANSEPASTVYFFPEWGFSMPFSLLTGNRLSMRTALDAPAVEDARRRFTKLQLAVWTEEQANRYAERLRELGIRDVTRRVVPRRSGEPGLYVLIAPLARKPT